MLFAASSPRFWLFVCALILASGADAAEVPFGRRELRIHDPSTPVRANGVWWVFGTGRRLFAAQSTDLLSWTREPGVLAESPAWAAEVAPGNRGAHYWAPDVVRIGGLWHLYYSVSEFGKNTSAIGLATSPTLDAKEPGHRWTDRGIVVRSRATDPFNAIDPSTLLDADGRLWMAFGSFWNGLYLCELDPATGLRREPAGALIHLARSAEIEAPMLHQRGGYYYLFFNEGLCCRAKDSTYRVRVGRALAVTGPYLDDQGRDLRDGGGRMVASTAGAFIGPGHMGIFRDGETEFASLHFYDGTRNGASALAIRRLRWTDAGWPEVEGGEPAQSTTSPTSVNSSRS